MLMRNGTNGDGRRRKQQPLAVRGVVSDEQLFHDLSVRLGQLVDGCADVLICAGGVCASIGRVCHPNGNVSGTGASGSNLTHDGGS
jgi:hypothetical protein